MNSSLDAPGSVGRSGPGRGRWWVVAVALGLAATTHLLAVVLYQTLPGPAAPGLRGAVDAYVVPHFTQDWRLFAPLPDAHDYGAYARALRRADDQLVPTPWVDLLDPLVAAVQANRLTGDGVTLEVVHKATLLTLHAIGPRAIFADSRAALVAQWSDLTRQPASLIVLESAASSLLAARHPDVAIEAVQVMVTARRVLPVGAAPTPEDVVTVVFEPVPAQRVATWPR